MNTIGVLGRHWRATVSNAGSIQPWGNGDEPLLDWFVAADDRWHVPSQEAAVRQRRIDNAPVFETRLRVPSGDAVQRVWCVADGGGYTVIEIENESTLPFAVAFSRNDILSVRPPTNVPIEGIELPEGSVVFPVGHHSTIRVALAHAGGSMASPTLLPDTKTTFCRCARQRMCLSKASSYQKARLCSPLVITPPFVSRWRTLAARWPRQRCCPTRCRRPIKWRAAGAQSSIAPVVSSCPKKQ